MTKLTVVLAIAIAASWAPEFQPRDGVTVRGQQAMGFDLDQTVHHFRLFPDGGSIEVTVKDLGDAANLTAIRSHLPHIAAMFAAGDFSMPHFIHAQDVPGSAQMIALKETIRYRYEELPSGGRVRVATEHAAALAAIHEFLRYQITDHRTGDSLAITRTP